MTAVADDFIIWRTLTPARGPRLAQDLDAVTELVARGPCRRAAALTREGSPIAIAEKRAWFFCPQGAAMLVTQGGPDAHMRSMDLMDALHDELPSCLSIATWADMHPWDEVVGLCRRAGARARGIE